MSFSSVYEIDDLLSVMLSVRPKLINSISRSKHMLLIFFINALYLLLHFLYLYLC